MLKDLYSSRFGTVLLGILLYLVLMVFVYTVSDTSVISSQHMGTFFLYLWKFVPSLVFPLQAILILFIAFFVTIVSTQQGLVRVYTLIGGVFYLFCMLLMRTQDTEIWVLISQILIVAIISMLLSPTVGKDLLSRFFYSGAVIGILILIYPPFFVLIPAYLISSNVTQKIDFKKLVVYLLGLLLPLVYLLSYLYLTNKVSVWFDYLPKFAIGVRNYDIQTAVVIFLFIIMVVLFLRDLNRFRDNYNWQSQQKRLKILFLALGVMLSTLISANYNPSYLMLNAPLLSIMMTMYYVNSKPNKFAMGFLYIFIILSLTLYLIN